MGARRETWAALLACLALIAAGCGDDGDQTSEGAVATSDPVRTFAPLVELAPDERYRPVGARWFIERSLLSVAAEEPCDDYAIAVGHTLDEQRTEANDWIFLDGLGNPAGYYRNPYDGRCEPDYDVRLYSSDPTRPYDPGPRTPGIGRGAGFYLDLVDGARAGDGAARVVAPVYAERIDEGDSGVRITYWMLFGANAPPGRPEATHEGDWERVDVLLREEGESRYLPEAVQLVRTTGDGAETRRDVPWDSVERVGDTHPSIAAAPGSHAMTTVGAAERCPGCLRWRTWANLADARRQPWYGFGGAWGEPGRDHATTGPLGPHGHWPTTTDRERALQRL